MRRTIPMLAAVAILLGTGLVHGWWTERWHKSPALLAAAQRLKGLPTEFGDWQSRPDEESVEGLDETRAEDWWVRRFTSRRTGKSVLVMLLVGRTPFMVAHRPENCYSGVGFELAGPPTSYTLRSAKGAPLGEFWTGRFVREEGVGNDQLRIFWSWLADGTWQAPSAPRWSFAGQPYLYKVYLLRDAGDNVGNLDEDPAVDLMRQLVPAMTKQLAPGR